jgi:hypothetical protein
MPTDRGAAAILSAGVQQGLARVADLTLVADRMEALRRRQLIIQTLGDIAGAPRRSLSSTSSVWSFARSGSPSRAVNRPAATGEAAGAGSTWRGTTARSRLRSTALSTQKIRSSAGTTWSGTSTSCSTATARCGSLPGWSGRTPGTSPTAYSKRSARPAAEAKDRRVTTLPHAPGAVIWRLARGGSSAGQSSGLIICRSWVRAPPAPPAVIRDIRRCLAGFVDRCWPDGVPPPTSTVPVT